MQLCRLFSQSKKGPPIRKGLLLSDPPRGVFTDGRGIAQKVNRLLSMFGFARRAGKLITGFDPVKSAVMNKEVLRVYTTADLSSKTLANVQFFCKQQGAALITCPFTMQEAGQMLGKVVGILAVTDHNMDAKIHQMLSQIPPTK